MPPQYIEVPALAPVSEGLIEHASHRARGTTRNDHNDVEEPEIMTVNPDAADPRLPGEDWS